MSTTDGDIGDLLRLRRDYADLVARLEANQVRFQRLARSIFRVQEDERRRLARDLHDGLGQNLTALRHQLMLAADEVGGEVSVRLAEAVALCDRTLAEMRGLSRLLRPQVLDDLGLLPALRWLARTLGGPAGLTVDVDADEVPAFDEDTRTLVFRLAQEALTNTVRHANARHAGFRLSVTGGHLRFDAWDDGCGFDPMAALEAAGTGTSTGLATMRERVALHGGTLRFVSRSGAGTQVRLEVPLPARPVTLDE